MLRKPASIIILSLLVVSALVLAFNVQQVRASPTIYIRADGSIDPPSAPISSIDNIIYTFTGNLYESIVIQRDNIVLEGSGYTLQGSGSGNGIDLTSTYNITIKNANIMGFYYGLYLYNSSNNVVLSNNMTENGWAGVELDHSTNNVISMNNMVANNYGVDLNDAVNNTVSENEIDRSAGMYAIGIRAAGSNDTNISGNNITANNNDGIWLLYSSNNIIIGNNLTANKHVGVRLDYSTNNSIIGNNITANGVYGVLLNAISSNNVVNGNNITASMWGIGVPNSSNYNGIMKNSITNNDWGIWLGGSSNNSIYYNHFVNNRLQVYLHNLGVNAWDCSYPSGGNYWSDYNGTDLYSGPYQNQTGSDGIGDTPYVIDGNNRDNYPLMKLYPWPAHDVAVTRVVANRAWVYQGLSANVNVTMLNNGEVDENVTVTLYYNITANQMIDAQNVTLSPGQNEIVTFVWDTTGVPFCQNYTITAVATIPLDDNPADNTLACGPINVRIMGDINGDRKVNLEDVFKVALAFGTVPGDSKWNSDADMNGDGKINLRDFFTVCLNFGKCSS